MEIIKEALLNNLFDFSIIHKFHQELKETYDHHNQENSPNLSIYTQSNVLQLITRFLTESKEYVSEPNKKKFDQVTSYYTTALIVVGDQSSGKSSLISALMGLPVALVKRGIGTIRKVVYMVLYDPKITTTTIFI